MSKKRLVHDRLLSIDSSECKGCFHCHTNAARLDKIEGDMQVVMQKLDNIFAANMLMMQKMAPAAPKFETSK